MAKFSRIVKLKPQFQTISHNGETYQEEKIDGAGLFEAPHAAADHFKEVGFTEDFAGDWKEAEERHTTELEAATDPKPVETSKKK
jgi:hypothetical protein